MARSEDEVKRAKQARAAHARAVRAANKEKREKLKANRIALMARARANKAQRVRTRLAILQPTLLRDKDMDGGAVLAWATARAPTGWFRPLRLELKPRRMGTDAHAAPFLVLTFWKDSRPPACDEAGSRLIDVQNAEVGPINPCIRVCTSDHAAEPPVRVMSFTTAPSQCSSASGDPDRHDGQDPPETARSTNAPGDNGRDARADSPPADPAIDTSPQLCSNPGANEHSSESEKQDNDRLLPQPAPAATEVGGSQQAESSEAQQAGSSEVQQARSTETKEAGSTEALEEDKLDWVDDACEYWGERSTSLKMRIDMLKGRKEKGRSIDENKLMYYRKINYEKQKKRKRERDIKRAALKKDAES
ncbi:hypothetical protein CSOJ01_15155 [Colletotrichum sojae]|uniref:Uncharacterized protein n=1 Tax=Colletotrichum sojae TaxID=2175907 RepID=A0A8H6IN82_9PEZI|nr:hypothetical protein CSOJ01_15155 [Colletotrichum sojae]